MAEDKGNSSHLQVSSSSSLTDTCMVGFVISNIVGVENFIYGISKHEMGKMVSLIREPLNPYDSNAIKVISSRKALMGHVEKTVAAVLSPMIDSNFIFVEGILSTTPNSPNSCKILSSSRNSCKILCQVHIFSRMELLSDVKTLIFASGLQLILDSDASFALSAAMLLKAIESGKGRKRSKIVDEIFDLVDKLDVKKKRDLVEVEPPKNAIKSELFMHQKEALGWLIKRENSDELPPFWKEHDGFFVNVLTKHIADNRPEPLRGGIFADDMGLGKTLTLLSLIAFDKYRCSLPCSTGNTGGDAEELNKEFSVSGSKEDNSGKPGKKDTGSQKKRKTDVTKFSSAAKGKSVCGIDKSYTDMEIQTTLVVCPPSVFSTWAKQLEQHTVPGTLKMYIYHGSRKNKDAEKLREYDIVLTTYSKLYAEMFWRNSPMKMLWRRIILDEAHIMKNDSSLQSQAVRKLKAKRRWVVTGTPIQHGTCDLFSLMNFLRFEPFSVSSYWTAIEQPPRVLRMQHALKFLQFIVATISLRRTKDEGLIEMPSKTVETHFIELWEDERDLYDETEKEAKDMLRGHTDSSYFFRNYSIILSIVAELRQICVDKALCPDLGSLLPSSNIEDVCKNPELLKKLVENWEDDEEFDCPICISPPSDIVITCCAHIFCRPCILKSLNYTNACCPLCRRHLTDSDLFSAASMFAETGDDAPSSSSLLKQGPSSKVSALMGLLLASRDQNPSRKSVVFSSFRKMLVRLEEPLKAAGFKVLRIDGSMDGMRRARILDQFSESTVASPMVLLASVRTSIAGINLTAVSTVYLFEPWWNGAIEEQAMARVHCIGQKEDVKIVRLIVRNSIEERLLKLQEKKKELARDASEGSSAKFRTLDEEDIRILMSL